MTDTRRGHLALLLQEAFTATVRLRANRQMAADAESFRTHMKNLLSVADQEARRAGYADGDVRFALYALVVFLDESVLNSQQPMFSAWPSRPLQEEVFGGHMGGELFFQYLQQLLAREDSDDLADVLEVYELCLLLGFQGRFTGSTSGELQVLAQRVGERIARIRGPVGPLAPAWAPPTDAIGAPLGDAWLRRLAIGAAASALLAVALFVGYRSALGSGADEVRAAAAAAPTVPAAR